MEGEIWFTAQPTPTYEKFETITIQVAINQVGGKGFASFSKTMTPEAGRKLAEEINRACSIVEEEWR